MLVTFGNLVSILVLSGSAKGMELGFVSKTNQFLLSFGNPFEAFPPIKIKEFVISCIDSTGDGTISRNDGKGFSVDLPIFPLNHYIITRSIPILVYGCLLLYDLLISVFAMTCPIRTHFFYLKYFQIATSHRTLRVAGMGLKSYKLISHDGMDAQRPQKE
jgi:hypothetical protein